MNETLIIAGGSIDIAFACDYLKNRRFEHIIAVDGGLESAMKMNLVPGYIVGDFDSINQAILNQYENMKDKIIKLNPEKDLTDTHSSINLAMELKSTNIVILGAIGTRIDHTIANIHILKIAMEKM